MKLTTPNFFSCHSRAGGNLYRLFIWIPHQVRNDIVEMKKAGFTLIELLIVIGITALLATVTIPSYLSFSRNQEVYQSTLNLKNVLRDTQNRALSSERSDTVCGTTDLGNTLQGFYATLIHQAPSSGVKTIAAGGLCGTNIIFNNTTPSYSNNSAIDSFVDATTCLEITLTHGGSLSILFKPLAQGAQFFDGDVATGVVLNNTKIGIVIKNSEGKSDYVIMQNSGDIYEKSTCP